MCPNFYHLFCVFCVCCSSTFLQILRSLFACPSPSLKRLPARDECLENGVAHMNGEERESRIQREVQRVHDETHRLLKCLEAKKAQLAALRGASNSKHRRLGSIDGGRMD